MQQDCVPLYPQMTPHVQKAMNTKEHNIMQPTAPPSVQTRAALVGPVNTVTTCPLCLASIKTSVRYTTTTRTHMTAALCCLVCCLCCIPYCWDSAKNADHFCPNCEKYIGTYEK